MFDSMIGKIIKPKKVEWNSPLRLTIETEEEKTEYVIQKGAETYLYSALDLKPNTSKEVFKKDEPTWKQLKDIQLHKAADKPNPREVFTLDKDSLVYIVNDNELIDVFDAKTFEAKKEFESSLEKFILDITTTDKTKKFYADGKGDIVKLICYDKDADIPSQDFTPVVLIEFSNKKASYKVYTGILIYKTFTFVPSGSTYLDARCYSDLVNTLDISTALADSTQKAESLYETYQGFMEKPVEISARELISLLKKVGYKLELKDDNQLDLIEQISDEESNLLIQKFFNTFAEKTGETAYDILALSEFKKIFRYNKLTVLDLLGILSKEHLSYEGGKITADILGDLVYTLYGKRTDKKEAESIRKEIKE